MRVEHTVVIEAGQPYLLVPVLPAGLEEYSREARRLAHDSRPDVEQVVTTAAHGSEITALARESIAGAAGRRAHRQRRWSRRNHPRSTSLGTCMLAWLRHILVSHLSDR